MPDPVRLLSIGKDSTLFTGGGAVQGDARRRHIRYAEVLRRIYGPDSEIRILTLTSLASGHRRDDPAPGLKLYGTASLHRATYMADVLALLPKVLAGGWRPTAVTTQTPWEEGVIGAVLARMLGAAFLPQLHFDIMSKDWRSESPTNFVNQQVGLWSLRRATRMRVVSTPLREKVSKRLRLSADAIAVIPVGVSFKVSTLSNREARAAIRSDLADRPVVLFVGRLVSSKNLPLWIDVASDVLARRPEARFVIAGGGEREFDLRQAIDARGLTDRILLIGPIGHERLPDIFAAADIFLLTSDHEGFGRVILEASLAGTPSVATRCAGPEDIIQDGVSGFLTPPKDRRTLGDRVLQLLDDETLRRRMGENAREFVEGRFGLDALATSLSHHWAGGPGTSST